MTGKPVSTETKTVRGRELSHFTSFRNVRIAFLNRNSMVKPIVRRSFTFGTGETNERTIAMDLSFHRPPA